MFNFFVMHNAHKSCGLAWLIFLLLFCSFLSNASTALEDLVNTDQLRSADFQKFSLKLRQLEASKNSLTEFEIQYLDLLLAYEASYQGNTEKAIQILVPLTDPRKDKILSFRAKALAINSLIVVRRYLDAFIYFEQLIAQLPDVDVTSAREHGLLVIAMMYRYLERYDLTLNYIAQLEGSNPTNASSCSAKQLKFNTLIASGKTDIPLADFYSALEFCDRNEQLLFATGIRWHLAQYLYELGNSEEAIRLIEQTYPTLLKTDYKRLITEYDVILAQIFRDKGNLELASKYANSVITNSPKELSTQPKIMALQLLTEVAKEQKNYQQALEYHEQYMAAFTAYMDDKSAQQMAYHTAHSEILAQNQKIALLDKDNQLLQLEQDKLKHQATSNQLLIVALVVMVLGLALMAYRSLVARQRFKALAEYDDLTAISNRYHFSVSAKDALNLCQKGQLPAALIVFDLDYFKQINDQYGHAAGDWALRQTVDTCRNFMRNNDVFGRIGGEEFAILLPGCQSDKAHLLADICRDAIKNIDTAASGYEFKLTASFGVTSAELSGYHLTKLIEDADTAMYQAKQQGRDKVHFFQG